jgi:DNA-directed RNA polymerase specialized sigma subunit
VERLWEEFKLKASADARERLILHYAPLVKYVAGRVSVGLPPNIEQADLVSYGIFGLIDAIEKYDLERGIKFETYAISRIKGAIIDELRAIDWIPGRSGSRRARSRRPTSPWRTVCIAAPAMPRSPSSSASPPTSCTRSSTRSRVRGRA